MDEDHRLRIAVFKDRPNCLLVLANQDGPVRLPELRAPFDRAEVSDALRDAGLPIRVVESVAGRWTQTALRLARDEKAERNKEQRTKEAVSVALGRNSEIASVREHSEALQKKQEVDERLRLLKQELSKAKSKVYTHGTYMKPGIFHEKQAELERLKLESQALQVRLGELRKEEKMANMTKANQVAERFVSVAREALDPDLFEAILSEAQGE